MSIASSIEGIKDDMKYLMLTVQQQNAENIILPSMVHRCTSKYQLQELDDSLNEPEKFNAMVRVYFFQWLTSRFEFSFYFFFQSTALQTIGGRDAVDTTRRILSKILTNELAVSYNWTGRNGKENFSLLKNLNTLILGKYTLN